MFKYKSCWKVHKLLLSYLFLFKCLLQQLVCHSFLPMKLTFYGGIWKLIPLVPFVREAGDDVRSMNFSIAFWLKMNDSSTCSILKYIAFANCIVCQTVYPCRNCVFWPSKSSLVFVHNCIVLLKCCYNLRNCISLSVNYKLPLKTCFSNTLLSTLKSPRLQRTSSDGRCRRVEVLRSLVNFLFGKACDEIRMI